MFLKMLCVCGLGRIRGGFFKSGNSNQDFRFSEFSLFSSSRLSFSLEEACLMWDERSVEMEEWCGETMEWTFFIYEQENKNRELDYEYGSLRWPPIVSQVPSLVPRLYKAIATLHMLNDMNKVSRTRSQSE